MTERILQHRPVIETTQQIESEDVKGNELLATIEAAFEERTGVAIFESKDIEVNKGPLCYEAEILIYLPENPDQEGLVDIIDFLRFNADVCYPARIEERKLIYQTTPEKRRVHGGDQFGAYDQVTVEVVPSEHDRLLRVGIDVF
ncbi:hypothetical protein ACFL1B_03915 [Nanoarchaeota archaeon]